MADPGPSPNRRSQGSHNSQRNKPYTRRQVPCKKLDLLGSLKSVFATPVSWFLGHTNSQETQDQQKKAQTKKRKHVPPSADTPSASSGALAAQAQNENNLSQDDVLYLTQLLEQNSQPEQKQQQQQSVVHPIVPYSRFEQPNKKQRSFGFDEPPISQRPVFNRFVPTTPRDRDLSGLPGLSREDGKREKYRPFEFNPGTLLNTHIVKI